jgi:hypothetical protein
MDDHVLPHARKKQKMCHGSTGSTAVSPTGAAAGAATATIVHTTNNNNNTTNSNSAVVAVDVVAAKSLPPKPEPQPSVKLDIASMKVKELQHELLSRGLPTKGRKADLQARLTEAVDAEELHAQAEANVVTAPEPSPKQHEEAEAESDPMEVCDGHSPVLQQLHKKKLTVASVAPAAVQEATHGTNSNSPMDVDSPSPNDKHNNSHDKKRVHSAGDETPQTTRPDETHSKHNKNNNNIENESKNANVNYVNVVLLNINTAHAPDTAPTNKGNKAKEMPMMSPKKKPRTPLRKLVKATSKLFSPHGKKSRPAPIEKSKSEGETQSESESVPLSLSLPDAPPTVHVASTLDIASARALPDEAPKSAATSQSSKNNIAELGKLVETSVQAAKEIHNTTTASISSKPAEAQDTPSTGIRTVAGTTGAGTSTNSSNPKPNQKLKLKAAPAVRQLSSESIASTASTSTSRTARNQEIRKRLQEKNALIAKQAASKKTAAAAATAATSAAKKTTQQATAATTAAAQQKTKSAEIREKMRVRQTDFHFHKLTDQYIYIYRPPHLFLI